MLWGGATLVDWLESGAQAVPADQATERARICSECPLSDKGDWTRHFTGPVTEAIRVHLERRKSMQLSTPHDEVLGICSACLCPLKLKVHMPLANILDRMPDDVAQSLAPGCWILSESAKAKS